MKQVSVISGKGGTGKTSITASFAALAEHHVMADGDVDAITKEALEGWEPQALFDLAFPILDERRANGDGIDNYGPFADQS